MSLTHSTHSQPWQPGSCGNLWCDITHKPSFIATIGTR